MIKKFSEEASINNLGSVQYDRAQKYLSKKEKKQAQENIGDFAEAYKNIEERLYSNMPIAKQSIRFSFSDLSYNPNNDSRKSSFTNMNGTWKKIPTFASNIWDYENTGATTFASEFYSGANNITGGFFNDENNKVKILVVDLTDVTDVSRMFSWNAAITDVLKFEIDSNVAGGVACNLLFNRNESLVSLPLTLDFTNANNLQYIFQHAHSLPKINEVIFPDDNTKNYSAQGCFAYCYNLVSIEKPVNLKSVTNIQNLFAADYSLTHVELENTSRITNASWAFAACGSLTNPPAIESTGVTNFSGIFSSYLGAQYLAPRIPITEIPAYDYTHSKNMSQAFYGTKLTVIPELNFSSSTENVSYLFMNCEDVETGMLRAYTYLKNLGTITNKTDCFKNCGINTESGKIERKYIPQTWGGDGPEE